MVAAVEHKAPLVHSSWILYVDDSVFAITAGWYDDIMSLFAHSV